VARPPAAGGLTGATGTDAEPTDAEPFAAADRLPGPFVLAPG
jgi:hypothetical protein